MCLTSTRADWFAVCDTVNCWIDGFFIHFVFDQLYFDFFPFVSGK